MNLKVNHGGPRAAFFLLLELVLAAALTLNFFT